MLTKFHPLTQVSLTPVSLADIVKDVLFRMLEDIHDDVTMLRLKEWTGNNRKGL